MEHFLETLNYASSNEDSLSEIKALCISKKDRGDGIMQWRD